MLEHWDYSKLIVHGKYERIDFSELLNAEHYYQFVDTCLGKGECYVSLTYAEHLAESILLGMIANRLPKNLHRDIASNRFVEKMILNCSISTSENCRIQAQFLD